MAVLTVCVVVALAAFAWRGWYTRYFVDDFCSANILQKFGFAEAMQWQREWWSGRYAFFAIKAPLETIGPITARFTPGVMVALMGLAAWWASRRTAVALFLTFAAIDSAPELFHRYGPFAWETGALTYMLPVVLFLVWLGLFARGRGVIVGALVLLVAGGLSETSLVAQCVMVIGALIASIVHRDAIRTRIAVASVLASLIALLIVVSAPGNEARANHLAPRGSILDASWRSLEVAYDFIGSHVFAEGASLLLVATAGLLVTIPRRVALSAMSISIACYLVSFLPSIWTLSAPPPPRALYIPNFFIILIVFFAFAALHVRLHFAVVLLAIVPVWSTIATVRTIPAARDEAQQIDAIMRFMQTRHGQDVTLHSPWALRSRYLGPAMDDPNTYCMSQYYRLRSLKVMP